MIMSNLRKASTALNFSMKASHIRLQPVPISVMLTAKEENTGSICPMISSPRGRRVRARDGTLPHRDPGRAGGHGRRKKTVRHRSRIRRSPHRNVSGTGIFGRAVRFTPFFPENHFFLIFPA